MAHTNRGRVITCGLLAGLVINVVEYVTHGVILSDAWSQAMQSLGRAAFSNGAIVMFIIMGFLLGIAVVWLYAAIRSMYGPGPKTAVRAGLVVWFISVFLPNLGMAAMALFPGRLLTIATIVSLFEIPIATLIGAWLYKGEVPVQAEHRAAA